MMEGIRPSEPFNVEDGLVGREQERFISCSWKEKSARNTGKDSKGKLKWKIYSKNHKIFNCFHITAPFLRPTQSFLSSFMKILFTRAKRRQRWSKLQSRTILKRLKSEVRIVHNKRKRKRRLRIAKRTVLKMYNLSFPPLKMFSTDTCLHKKRMMKKRLVVSAKTQLQIDFKKIFQAFLTNKLTQTLCYSQRSN